MSEALLELESLVDGEQLQGGGATKPGMYVHYNVFVLVCSWCNFFI